jgi:hypothetical protein
MAAAALSLSRDAAGRSARFHLFHAFRKRLQLAAYSDTTSILYGALIENLASCVTEVEVTVKTYSSL